MNRIPEVISFSATYISNTSTPYYSFHSGTHRLQVAFMPQPESPHTRRWSLYAETIDSAEEQGFMDWAATAEL